MLPVGPGGEAHALAYAVGGLSYPVEEGGKGEVCRLLVGLVVVATLPVVSLAVGGTRRPSVATGVEGHADGEVMPGVLGVLPLDGYTVALLVSFLPGGSWNFLLVGWLGSFLLGHALVI